MATLVWNEDGQRVYQSGVERGVLYLLNKSVPWNGLISVDESSDSERKSYFLDGVKFLEAVSPSDFKAKLKAYTYPDEFDSVNGIATVSPGLELHEQPPKSFGLSYRSKVGNDLEGFDYGYKIHLLYNVIATPEDYSYETLGDSSVKPIEFGWDLAGTPVKIDGFRPTTQVTIDSRKTPARVLRKVELLLYGSRWVNASLPTLQELKDLFIPPEEEL